MAANESEGLSVGAYEEACYVLWGPPSDDQENVKLLWWEQTMGEGERGREKKWVGEWDQPRNGPCGALAAIQAIVAACVSCVSVLSPSAMVEDVEAAFFLEDAAAQRELLAHAFALILARSQPHRQIQEISPPFSLCNRFGIARNIGPQHDFAVKVVLPLFLSPEDDCSFAVFDASSLSLHTVRSFDSLVSLVTDNLRHFLGKGGLILFLLSVVCTTGVACIHSDMEYGSLISEELGFCTQALVNLLISGQATYDIGGKTSTRHNVHRNPASSPALSPSPSSPPRVRDVLEVLSRRLRPDGQAEYECLLAATAASDSLLFPQPAQWRCRACTANEPRVWAAVNDGGSATCKECRLPRDVAGRCHWLAYDELPPMIRQEVDILYAHDDVCESGSARG